MPKSGNKIKNNDLVWLKRLRLFGQILAGMAIISIIWQIPSPKQTEIVETVAADSEINTSESLMWQLPHPAPIPISKTSISPPLVSAKGVYIVDPVSKVVLYQKNESDLLLPASTTKLMTAIIAVETYDPDQLITITEEENTIGNTLKLKRGEVLSAKELLAGVLISSGNDAALALALSYPKTGYSGFVAAMNKKAKELGLSQTNFKNVSGVESPGHITTARDMAILTMYALSKPEIKNLVSIKNMDIYSQTGEVHRLINTNELLGVVDGLYGVKTGWTENAGECLITAINRDEGEVVVVVLGSLDRFGESALLIDWVYKNFDWVEPEEYLESLQS